MKHSFMLKNIVDCPFIIVINEAKQKGDCLTVSYVEINVLIKSIKFSSTYQCNPPNVFKKKVYVRAIYIKLFYHRLKLNEKYLKTFLVTPTVQAP